MADERVVVDWVTRYTSVGATGAARDQRSFRDSVSKSTTSADENRRAMERWRQEVQKLRPEVTAITDKMDKLARKRFFNDRDMRNLVLYRDRLRGIQTEMIGLDRDHNRLSRSVMAAGRSFTWIGGRADWLRNKLANGGRGAQFLNRELEKLAKTSFRKSISGQWQWITTLASIFGPALPQAITLVTQALGTLGGGAVGLIASVRPLVPVLAAIPAGISMIGQAAVGLKLAFGGMKTTMKNVFAAAMMNDVKAFDKALAKLPVSARGFAKFIRSDVVPELKSLREYAQNQMFPALERAFKAASPNIPVISRALRGTIGVFRDFVGKLGQELGKSDWRAFFQVQGGRNNRWMKELLGATIPLSRAFRDLTLAAGPIVDWIVKLVVHEANLFSRHVALQKSTGALADRFEHARGRLSLFVAIIRHVAHIIGGVTKAAEPLGTWMLKGIEKNTRAWADWSRSFRGQERMKKFFDALKPELRAVARLAVAMGRTIAHITEAGGIGTLADNLRTKFLPVLEKTMINVNKNLGPALYQALTNLLTLAAEITDSNFFSKAMIGILDGISRSLLVISKIKIPFLGELGPAAFAIFGVWRALRLIGAIRFGAFLLTQDKGEAWRAKAKSMTVWGNTSRAELKLTAAEAERTRALLSGATMPPVAGGVTGVGAPAVMAATVNKERELARQLALGGAASSVTPMTRRREIERVLNYGQPYAPERVRGRAVSSVEGRVFAAGPGTRTVAGFTQTGFAPGAAGGYASGGVYPAVPAGEMSRRQMFAHAREIGAPYRATMSNAELLAVINARRLTFGAEEGAALVRPGTVSPVAPSQRYGVRPAFSTGYAGGSPTGRWNPQDYFIGQGPMGAPRVPLRERLGGLRSRAGGFLRSPTGGIAGITAGITASILAERIPNKTASAIIGGAGTGLAVGASFGPVGMAVGAGAGALIGVFSRLHRNADAAALALKRTAAAADRVSDARRRRGDLEDTAAGAQRAVVGARIGVQQARTGLRQAERQAVRGGLSEEELARRTRGGQVRIQGLNAQQVTLLQNYAQAVTGVGDAEKYLKDALKERNRANEEAAKNQRIIDNATKVSKAHIDALINTQREHISQLAKEAQGTGMAANLAQQELTPALDKLRGKLREQAEIFLRHNQPAAAQYATAIERLTRRLGHLPNKKQIEIEMNTGEVYAQWVQLLQSIGRTALRADVQISAHRHGEGSGTSAGGAPAKPGAPGYVFVPKPGQLAPTKRGGGRIGGPATRDGTPVMASGGEFFVTGGGERILERVTGMPGILDWLEGVQPPHFGGGGRFRRFAKGGRVAKLERISPLMRSHLFAGARSAYSAGFQLGVDPTSGGITDILGDALYSGAFAVEGPAGSKGGKRGKINPGIIPDWVSGKQRKVLTKMLAEESRISGLALPYVYGGGHSNPAPANGPFDCSSAVSRVLQASGLGVPTMTSGSFLNYGAPGKGETFTIWARPGAGKVGHVFLETLRRGWGTSTRGPHGGGPDWLSSPYRSGFTARHIPGFAKGGRVPKWARPVNALMHKLWPAASAILGVGGQPMPRTLFGKDDLFVGVDAGDFKGGHPRASSKRSFYYPGFLANALAGRPDSPPWKQGINRDSVINNIIHEWVHYYQGKKALRSHDLAEGGAEAFAQKYTGWIAAQSSVKFDPTKVQETYPWEQFTARRKGAKWLGWGQFGGALGRRSGGRVFQTGGRVPISDVLSSARVARGRTRPSGGGSAGGIPARFRQAIGRVQTSGGLDMITETLISASLGQMHSLAVWLHTNILSAQRRGRTQLVSRLQGALNAVQTAIGFQVGRMLAPLEGMQVRASRADTRFGQDLRRAGIDAGSVAGLTATRGNIAQQLDDPRFGLRAQQAVIQRTLNKAKATGAPAEVVAQIQSQLDEIKDAIYEAVTTQIENARDILRTQLQEAVDRASHELSMANIGMQLLQAQQSLLGISETPAAMRARAQYIMNTIVPQQRAHLAALQSQYTGMGGNLANLGFWSGGIVGPRSGGTPIIVGEAGAREYVLSTDPRHRRNTDVLLSSFLRETGRFGAKGKPPAKTSGLGGAAGYAMLNTPKPADAIDRWLGNQNATTIVVAPPTTPTVTTATTAELENVAEQIGQATVDLANSLAEAAELMRQAALAAAQALVDAAQHQTNMVGLSQTHLELQQRIAGTYDTGATERVALIQSQLIPSIQGDIVALQNELQVAKDQGNQQLADQIAEAIAGKQNDILSAQLDMQEQIKEEQQRMTDALREFGGSIAFQFGGQAYTDLVSIGVGL